MNLQNLKQENGTLLTTKTMDNMLKEMIMIQPLTIIYSDVYIIVTGNITATRGNANTKAAFKSCVPFRRCVNHINDEHVETAENLDIIMPMYNFPEYSDNYADSSGSLYHFKRDKQNMNADGNLVNVTTANSSSFKYKSSLLGNPAASGVLKNSETIVPLKYLSNFSRSLEIPIINCKIHLELS